VENREDRKRIGEKLMYFLHRPRKSAIGRPGRRLLEQANMGNALPRAN
jgi:hypothetical protein